MEQELERKLELHNPTVHQTNENCQVFTGPISGCVFAMPGANVNLSAKQEVEPSKDIKKDKGEMPEALATDKAMLYWERLQKAGLVDEHCLPLVSRTKAALIANEMAECLNIPYKWSYFEDLWQRKNMRKDYNCALDQMQSLAFQDLLKEIFAD